MKTTRKKGESLTVIPKDYTVIDIETTGYDARYDEIIEIGAIKVRDHKIVDKFESLVKPSSWYCDEELNCLDDFIIELTGITNEMLELAPFLDNILPDYVDFIDDDILLGHNVHFDINFLYDVMLEKLNHEFSNNFVDLLRLVRRIYPDFKNHKLDTVATNLNVDITNKHRSLRDCEITYDSFIILKDHIKKENIDLEKLFMKKYYSSGKKSIDLTKIQTDNIVFDKEHLLFNKFCTFTGKLEKMTRKEAAQIVVNLGGYCLNNVTKKTNFIILGNFDYCFNIKGDKSSKLKKAEAFILEGLDLQVLSEDVFYDLIFNN